jgi:predicted Zn-dependent protease
LGDEAAAKFDRKQIEKRVARVAVSMTHVIARHGTHKQIEEMARFISTLSSRKVLLVPLFVAVRVQREKELATGLRIFSADHSRTA